MRFCGKCGAEISEKAIYCEMCGVKLIDHTEPKNTQIVDKTEGVVDQDIEEIDLTNLDKNLNITTPTHDSINIDINPSSKFPQNLDDHNRPKKKIIDINEVLESEEKVKMDDGIKREVLADEDELTKVCPMCGEEMTINKKLLENTPVMVKCLKCGQETKIW